MKIGQEVIITGRLVKAYQAGSEYRSWEKLPFTIPVRAYWIGRRTIYNGIRDREEGYFIPKAALSVDLVVLGERSKPFYVSGSQLTKVE